MPRGGIVFPATGPGAKPPHFRLFAHCPIDSLAVPSIVFAHHPFVSLPALSFLLTAPPYRFSYCPIVPVCPPSYCFLYPIGSNTVPSFLTWQLVGANKAQDLRRGLCEANEREQPKRRRLQLRLGDGARPVGSGNTDPCTQSCTPSADGHWDRHPQSCGKSGAQTIRRDSQSTSKRRAQCHYGSCALVADGQRSEIHGAVAKGLELGQEKDCDSEEIGQQVSLRVDDSADNGSADTLGQ